MNLAEWRKLTALHWAALDGLGWSSDSTLPRSKGIALCIEWSSSARLLRCLPCLANVYFTRHFSAPPSEAALFGQNWSHKTKRTCRLPDNVPVFKPGSYSVKTVLFTLSVGWLSAALFGEQDVPKNQPKPRRSCARTLDAHAQHHLAQPNDSNTRMTANYYYWGCGRIDMYCNNLFS